MKTLAILSRKGGTGKTTLAVNLSVAAERAGHSTILIDLDPQASAAKWNDNREGDAPVVVAAPASRLPRSIEKSRGRRGDPCDFGHRPPYRDRSLRCSRCCGDGVNSV